MLEDNEVHFIATMAAAPVRTLFNIVRVEDGLYLASLGGSEGLYPSAGEESVMKFAREVRAWLKARRTALSVSATHDNLLMQPPVQPEASMRDRPSQVTFPSFRPGSKWSACGAACMQELWHPCASSILAGCEFKTPVTCAHKLNSTWRHYEELALPDGLLVLGDAVCSLNPTYGQGMTVAAVEVAKLGALLSARAAAAGAGAAASGTVAAAPGGKATAAALLGAADGHELDVSNTRDSSSGAGISSSSAGGSAQWLAGLHKEFQKAIHTTIKNAWDMAVGADMAFESASSDEPYAPNLMERLAAAYVKELFKLADTDYQVCMWLTCPTGMVGVPGAWQGASDRQPLLLNWAAIGRSMPRLVKEARSCCRSVQNPACRIHEW